MTKKSPVEEEPPLLQPDTKQPAPAEHASEAATTTVLEGEARTIKNKKDNDDDDDNEKEERDDDDDDDDDEDYHPDQDPEAVHGDVEVDVDDDGDHRKSRRHGRQQQHQQQAQSQQHHLTPSQWHAVDRAFEELFHYPWGTTFGLPTSNNNDNSHGNQEHQQQAHLLCRIFGVTTASRILFRHQATTMTVVGSPHKRKRDDEHRNGNSNIDIVQNEHQRLEQEQPRNKKNNHRTIMAMAQPASLQQLAVPKSVSMATATTTTTTTMEIAAPAITAAAATTAAPVGVDQLLKQLAVPEKISTVAQTSADWDQFKDSTGLGHALEEQATSNAAYLKRQDFLHRVDHRTFDLEKRERERNRLQRK